MSVLLGTTEPEGASGRDACVPVTRIGTLRRVAGLLGSFHSRRSGNLPRLRLAFFAFAAFNCAVVLILLLSAATGPVRLAGVAGAVFLGTWWTYAARRGGSAWPGDGLEAIAILAMSIAVGAPEKAFGVYYGTLFFRSLYGSAPRAVARALSFLAALIVAVQLSPAPVGFGARVMPHAFAFVFTAIVMQLVQVTLRRYERSLRRERILRDLSIDLTTAHDAPAMHAVVLNALSRLGVEDATVRVGLALGDMDEMRLVAVSGHDAAHARDGVARPADLGPRVRDGLNDGRTMVVSFDGDDTSSVTTFAAKKVVALVPLRIGGVLSGALSYSSDEGVPEDLAECSTRSGRRCRSGWRRPRPTPLRPRRTASARVFCGTSSSRRRRSASSSQATSTTTPSR